MADAVEQLYELFFLKERDVGVVKALMAQVFEDARMNLKSINEGYTDLYPEMMWETFIFRPDIQLSLTAIDHPAADWITYKASFISVGGNQYHCSLSDYGLGDPVFKVQLQRRRR